MLVYGIDFTSAPTPSKPITVAACALDGDRLRLRRLLRIRDFDGFEASLDQPGPWIAAMDFPFGLPRKLVTGLRWSDDWPSCVEQVAALTRPEFEDLLLLYKAARPPGDKEHRRKTDELCGAQSPMKLHGVPLAKMFFEGARRLRASSLNVLPCRPRADGRTVVEGYPALVARHLIGRRSYKQEDRGKQEQARHDARLDIARLLTGGGARQAYGVRLEIGSFVVDELVDDSKGDLLDAVLCAVQAAWAARRAASGYGIPADCDALEGWIVDPGAAGE